jgi:hypothetical protein
MSAHHTAGRVRVQHPYPGDRGWEVAFEPGLEQLCQDISQANARRLAACWNACEGLHTESLERDKPLADQLVDALNQRDELLEALQAIISDGVHCDVVPHLHRQAVAAIAKATGGES